MLTLLVIIFVLGYAAIAFEHGIHINKAASALITGVLCWTVYIVSTSDTERVSDQLTEHLGDLSAILFFLLGAMTIVELIDVHDGFNLITDRITQTNKRTLLWIVSFIAFFLSPLLDNLTTTIVMVSLIRKLVNEREERLLFAGMVIIAANAGGAWSPIGDVTTTMLWIGKQVTAGNIILQLFIPSLTCLLVPLMILSFRVKGVVTRPEREEENNSLLAISKAQQAVVFFSGVLILLMVPVFKTITHLPPYMGILIGLGFLWLITDIMHGDKSDIDKHHLSVSHALRKVDTPSILFFLGILLSIAALESTGMLTNMAGWLSEKIGNQNVIVASFGLLSSLVDNVPLVAAAQGMYSLDQYPTDHSFWLSLAYTTGTGGSALIIGSAAGVAAMGMEKIDFFWYLKNITLLALAGFFAGALVYILQYSLLS
jgi:Na+/H+ antiporter NhaD/arsenite permease-like protein